MTTTAAVFGTRKSLYPESEPAPVRLHRPCGRCPAPVQTLRGRYRCQMRRTAHPSEQGRVLLPALPSRPTQGLRPTSLRQTSARYRQGCSMPAVHPNQDCTGAAERVIQLGVLFDKREVQHSRSKWFTNRSFICIFTVAALVQPAPEVSSIITAWSFIMEN